MSLKDRAVGIAYELKDRFTKQVGKITSSFGRVERASATSSAKIEANNARSARSFGGIAVAASKVKLGILALGAVILGGVSAISKWTAAASQQIRAETKLETTLTNLTGASKQQIQALKDQASALQELTGYGDDETVSAQAMLGTFQLTAEQIQQLTPRLLDMAESTRKVGAAQVDMETISIALGKAMTNGIGSLSRYGVAMSDAQKEAFKLADQNEKVAILAEVLDGNFKGLAEAVGNTYEGAIRKGDQAQGDFLETLGFLFTRNKAWISLQKTITDGWLKMSKGVSASSAEIGVAVTLVANTIIIAANGIKVAFNVIQIAIKSAVALVIPPLELLTRTLAAITVGDTSTAFKLMSDDIRAYSRELTDGIKGDFDDIVEAGGNIADVYLPAEEGIKKVTEANKALTPTIETNTDATDKAATAAKKLAEAQEKQLDTAAKRIYDETRTDLEKLSAKQAEYKALLDAGKISQDTFNRAMQKTQEIASQGTGVERQDLSLSEQAAQRAVKWEQEKLKIKQEQLRLDRENPFLQAKLRVDGKLDDPRYNAENDTFNFGDLKVPAKVQLEPDVQAAIDLINQTVVKAQSQVKPIVVPVVYQNKNGNAFADSQFDIDDEALASGSRG